MPYSYRAWIYYILSGVLFWTSLALFKSNAPLLSVGLISGFFIFISATALAQKIAWISKSRFINILLYIAPLIYLLLIHFLSRDNPTFLSIPSVDFAGISVNSLEILLWSLFVVSTSLNVFKVNYSEYRPKIYSAIFKTVVSYFVILLGIEFLFRIVGKLLYIFDIQPDFTQLTAFTCAQFHVISVFFLLTMLIFITTHHLTTIIQFYIPSVLRRLGVFSVVILFFYFVHQYLNPDIQYLHFLLGISSLIVLMDLYSEFKQRSFSWMLVWLILVSGLFTIVFISKQHVVFIDQISKFDISTDQLDAITSNNTSKNIHLAIESGSDNNAIYGIFKDIGLHQFSSAQNVWNYDQYFIKKKSFTNATYYFAIPKSGLISSINLFTVFFTIGFIFLIFIGISNSYLNYLPKNFYLSFDFRKSMKNRIQLTLIGTVLFSFIVIGISTVYFIDIQQIKNANSQFTKEANSLLMKSSQNGQSVQPFMEYFNTNQLGYAINVFNLEGKPSMTSDLSATIEHEIINKIHDTKATQYLFNNKDQNRITDMVGQVNLSDNTYLYKITKTDTELRYATSSTVILNTLMKVYVFLFLVAYAIAILITNSITWPLITLSEKLKHTTFGDNNQEIEWPNQDEIGQLIENYNVMLKKLHQSASLLARNERELAWREMAKQVAHEIKNPLTPMKLSIQYLQHASNSGSQNLDEMIKKVSHTLIEQIDNLTRIATEFSNFAKMPNAQNEKIVLNDVVVSVHNLFRKREDMDIQCYLPIDEIYVFADKDHLIRIMNNLIKNAIQAIPTERPGVVIIRLTKSDEKAIISIEDNGVGIPESMKQKIFEPNFTTKSSGTGLGLAMCANMINGFNGNIYFTPNEGVGSTFFVEIPMMRLEYNFKVENRVSL